MFSATFFSLARNSTSALAALCSLVHCSVSGRCPRYTSPASARGPEEIDMNPSASVTGVMLPRNSDSVTSAPAFGTGPVVREGPLGKKPW
uniref:Secreted protein n=1 Tax=Setaria viridis TaxID=4556 RepID=A0A4U6VAD7_SETVI|nr:hypothetical protein SEVIR_3G023850v2 [Setaria viridis]